MSMKQKTNETLPCIVPSTSRLLGGAQKKTHIHTNVTKPLLPAPLSILWLLRGPGGLSPLR